MKTILSLIFLAVVLSAQQAMAQETPMKTAAGAFFCCLQEKWPDIKYTGGGHYAFIPETGQNLAWDDKQGSWIDTKTLQPVHGGCKTLAGAFFKCCLQKKWPDIKYTGGGHYAFIPETAQNLAWDGQKRAWIDVKTGKCICPECPGQTAENVLKTIGRSIHIQIGGGGTFGHDEHHHGEDRHRTAEKVSTDKTKTHKTSPTTTHKTVTSACKCHPCTCAPCNCH